MWQHWHEDETARANVARVMENDPNTVDVIASMRSQGRTWARIALCFREQIAEILDRQPK
jgi:hypothetical protein